MKLEPDEIIYVMEKFVMNRDYPSSTDGGLGKIKPYHDGWYMVVIGSEENLNRYVVAGEFRKLEDLVEFLRPFSGKYPIRGERHTCFSEEIDFEGDVEVHRGIIWRYYNELKKAGIEIEGFD